MRRLLMRTPAMTAALVGVLGMVPGQAFAQTTKIDLRTHEGVKKVKGEWRYSDVKIVEVDSVGPNKKPNKTYTIEPKAYGPEFDDSRWAVLDPTTLQQRRSTGQLCFNWYRIKVTIPEEAAGKTVTFVTTVDDYGEVWVDGQLPRKDGDSGGPVVAGFKVPNRVVLKDPKPGKTYQIAIFGMNGPISATPSNYIFLLDTHLELGERK
jgi:gluconolactonase